MTPAWAEDLFLAYPPAEHQTTADRIFLIGTADPDRPVLVNGEAIEDRSTSGHFAPTVPLAMGENVLVLTQGDANLTVRVTRITTTLALPAGASFLPDSLLPQVDMTRQVGEWVCFGAVAAPNAEVSVNWGNEAIALAPQPNAVELPPNSAVFTAQNEPVPLTTTSATAYKGCTVVPSTGALGSPQYTINLDGQPVNQAAPGAIDRVVQPFQVAEVIVESGVARTGPSTNYSRITPLPQGTRAIVTGTEGDWLRLDYGGWIRASETQITTTTAPPRSIIRSVTSQQIPGWTEVRFPLQVPVPIGVEQTADTFTLTLHNTTPQTDTIFLNADAAIERLDWIPILPDKAQYRFQLRSNQQWGYKLRYEGTTLVLSLRHPPQQLTDRPLSGMTILVDPGHGGEELGARGPNGYPEKEMNLVVSKLLRTALEARGAMVVMTREGDETVSLGDRIDAINEVEPTLALSIHYNALPDEGDALNTAGVGMFWYNAQAHSLAQFLHDRLVMTLDRPSDGVYWNNLALTRPTVAPSILLELGFAINPYEFEWITNPDAQAALAEEITNAIELWVKKSVL
ncbi:MAG: N-acetylmuramoyl-L-alanine amidase [Cyanobacteria bacterium J06641_5]